MFFDPIINTSGNKKIHSVPAEDVIQNESATYFLLKVITFLQSRLLLISISSFCTVL